MGNRREKRVLTGIVATVLAVGVVAGVAGARDWLTEKFWNVGGITIGSTTVPADRTIGFETGTNAAHLSFRAGDDDILMRAGNDTISLGRGNSSPYYDFDVLSFHKGDGEVSFGANDTTDLFLTVPLEPDAWMKYTDSGTSLDVGANGNVSVRSVGGDVIVQLGGS